MKNSKRITAFLLAALMGAELVSCASSPVNPEEETGETEGTVASETETEAEEEFANSRLAEQDNLPEMDFGGRDFIVVGSEEEGFDKFITVEELNGEGVNDAIYTRNLTVDERFNAKVAYLPTGTYGDAASTIAKAVTAGDSDSFHLTQYHVVSSSGNAVKNYYMNWYDIPHVDFSRPWWSDSTVEDLTVNNVCFLAVGDFALSSVARTYVMLYDKDEVANYQLEDPYTAVKEGRWTVDYLNNLSDSVYTDRNGNGTVEEGDYFGLATDSFSNLNTYFWSTGNHVIMKDDAGVPYISYYSEHLVDSYDALSRLIGSDSVYKEGTHKAGMRLFSEYGSLTCNAYLDGTISFLADFEHDYGVIPYPKSNEAQADYMTMVDGNHEAMAVAKNAVDLEFIGIMCEVLCAESYKQVMPVYFDVCLKQRYASSPKDAEMMDLCVSSRVFDFGYVYDNWNGASFWFQNLLADTTHPDITSYYEKQKKVITKYYEKVFKLFLEPEE